MHSIRTRESLIDGDLFEALAFKYGLSYSETDKIRPRELSGQILTHNSDGCILPEGVRIQPRPSVNRTEDYSWGNVPASLQFWFAQNVDVVDDRLIPIPIGLERDRWHPSLHKKDVILTLPDEGKSHLCYLNFNKRTNRIRPILYSRFKTHKWCTTEHGRNGIGFSRYAKQIKCHKFVLCPEGNGMDTHRLWETLYLGSYPIVKHRVFTEAFAEILPILVVDDWGEVTKSKLDKTYLEFNNTEWKWEALTMDFWEQEIICQARF